jgi:hypothetical protein
MTSTAGAKAVLETRTDNNKDANNKINQYRNYKNYNNKNNHDTNNIKLSWKPGLTTTRIATTNNI